MKKMIAFFLVLALALSCAACGKAEMDEPSTSPGVNGDMTPEPTLKGNEPDDEEPEDEPGEDGEEDEQQPEVEPVPETTPELTEEPNPAPVPENTPEPTPEPTPGESENLSLTEILEQMIAASGFDGGPFFEAYAVTKEDAPYTIGYEGFSGEFEEALGYGPMMGSMAFIMVLFRLDDGADAQSFADDIKSNADPRKWICVEAETVEAIVSGNTVLFIMSDADSASQLTSAFTQVME